MNLDLTYNNPDLANNNLDHQDSPRMRNFDIVAYTRRLGPLFPGNART